MTVTIELNADQERRLRDEAAKEGVQPNDIARRLVERGLESIDSPSRQGSTESPPQSQVGPPDTATVALFKKWEREDRIEDPDELAKEEAEYEQFMQDMNENRRLSGQHGKVFP